MENKNVILKETTTGMTMDTRELAESSEISHRDILNKIQGTYDKEGKVKQVGIIPTLAKAKLLLSDYYIESTYKDESGKQNKCYLCTKKGCEILANKFIGEKGILFTIKYVDAFNSMETTLKQLDNSSHTTLSLSEDKKLMVSIKDVLDEVKQVTMVLTHKQKLDLTKGVIYPQLEMLGIESKCKKEVTKIIKESLITNGKWENIRIDDKFDKSQFKIDVRECAEIIKKNNPCYFKNCEFENISLFD